MTIPFMVMSDAPITTTGLARITRELLKRMRTDPEISSVFRVASLGLGQRCYKSQPYPQYPATMQNYQVPEILEAWADFAQGQDGVLMTIWNPSWLFWMPQLSRKPFSHWAYLPIDAEGPGGKLPKEQMAIINSFDRKLAYSAWAGKMVGCDYLPHGIDTSIYHPKQVEKHERLTIGICATNTRRKDWGLGIETCATLKQRGYKVKVQIKIDCLLADWNLTGLLEQFDLASEDVDINCNPLLEEQMADWYCDCDVTLAIGSGEGFGYPIAESLACGVSCIHGNYAAGPELKPTLVEPVGYRWEGFCNDKRPIYDASMWADAVEDVLDDQSPTLSVKYDWNFLWPRWKEWLLKGVK